MKAEKKSQRESEVEFERARQQQQQQQQQQQKKLNSAAFLQPGADLREAVRSTKPIRLIRESNVFIRAILNSWEPKRISISLVDSVIRQICGNQRVISLVDFVFIGAILNSWEPKRISLSFSLVGSVIRRIRGY